MAQTTTALLCRGADAPPTLETVAIGEPRSNEALVEIHASGLCHTDIGCMSGELPAQFPCIFGHEGAGVVKAVGADVKHVGAGDKVLLSFASCGDCEPCKSTHPAYCLQFMGLNFGGSRLDGTTAYSLPSDSSKVHANFFGQSSFARMAIVDVSSLVKVPPSTNLELFAPLGCGIQTGVGSITNTLDVQPGKSVAVFGAGGVGLSALMAAKIRGANPIIAVDLVQSRLDLAKKLGATHAINGGDKDVLEQIQKIAPPTGVNYSVDTTGVVKVIETAIQCLGMLGKAATVGAPPPGSKVSVDVFSHLAKGVSYMGCIEGDSVPATMIPWLIQQHAEGKFPLEEMITYYDAKDLEKAIKDSKDGTTVKPILRWNEQKAT